MTLLTFLLLLTLSLPVLSTQVKILNTPNDRKDHPSECALTCSGVAPYDKNNFYGWKTWGSGEAYKRINIAGCGFIRAPVVTATLSGYYLGGDKRCPSVYINIFSRKFFHITTVENASVKAMMDNRCDVYWIATGFVC